MDDAQVLAELKAAEEYALKSVNAQKGWVQNHPGLAQAALILLGVSTLILGLAALL